MPMLPTLLPGVLGAMGGAMAGVLGSFVHGYTTYSVPLGLVTALALSGLIFIVSGIAARGRSGAAVAVTAWLLPVLLLSVRRPEGDLIVPGTALGYAWLIGGMVVGSCAVAWPYGNRVRSTSPFSGVPNRPMP